MKRISFILALLILIASGSEVFGQKMKKGPDKQKNQVTPENHGKQPNLDKERKQAEYQMKSDHHRDIQDDATRKRMKKNLRRSQKHSWGKEIPWYKRWFHRRKV